MDKKKQEILKSIDKSMECVMESDPRTFKDPNCEYGWLFNKIAEWHRELSKLIDD